MDVNIMWDSSIGWKNQELSLWKIELKMMVPNSNRDITEAC